MMRTFAIWRKRIRPPRTETPSVLSRPSRAAVVSAVISGTIANVEEQGIAMASKVQPLTGINPAASPEKAGASLSNEEILRYSRHLIMPEVGMEGQLKLKNAKVLLIGTGGLGAPLGLYLAAAGIGRLGLVDFDVVDFTNLQRQVTFGSSDVGKPKAEAARARLANLNP